MSEEAMIATTESSTGQKAGYVLIFPDMAKKWLAENNQMNRSKREKVVNKYQQQMESEEWDSLNGDTIVFDNEGLLTNGQHRLEAIVRSGQPQEYLVVYGVKPESRVTLDDNVRRLFYDDLSMNGVRNAHHLDSLLTNVLRWDTFGGLSREDDITFGRKYKSKVWSKYEKELQNSQQEIERWRSKWPGNTAAARFMYWLLVHRMKCDKRAVERYFSILAIGSQDPADYVLVQTRDKLQDPVSMNVRGRKTFMPTHEEVWWLIDAWNRWLLGKHFTGIGPRKGFTNPYPLPVVAERERK